MIIFDTETTGLPKPDTCPLSEQPKIIEFAAIKVDDKTLKEGKNSRLEFFCNPGEKLDEFIIKNCHITDAMLAGKPSFANFLPKVVDFFLGERILVAHNIGFDIALLRFELMRLGKLTQFPWPPVNICTVEASFPLKNFRLNLGKLHTHVTGKAHVDAHRAMSDTDALLTCVRWLRKEKML